MPAARILPVAQQAPSAEGACCGSCATAEAEASHRPTAQTVPMQPTRPATPLPVLERARPAISRSGDRRVTFGGVVVAALLLAAALGSVALPDAVRRGIWLPLHLGLAGAAATAVAAVLPFFTAALSVAPPTRSSLRVAAIAMVATAAVAISAGVVAGAPAVAVPGGLLYVAGVGTVAAVAFAPLRRSLGPRRRLVEAAYGAALAYVAVGAMLATAMLADWGPVTERWAVLKPAHAWLNVLGFLTLVVAASLLHLAPTVAGTRMRPRPSAALAVGLLAAGAPVVAAGFALELGVVARIGAVLEIAGAVALVGHGIAVWRDRGAWTTDPAWHRFTSWSLLAAPCWLLVATALAGVRVLVEGASFAGWSIADVAAPLALGWLAQVLVGSWSHIVPAIGPGDSAAHARQRAVLGRAATARIVGLNVGTGVLTAGMVTGSGALVAVGAGLVGVSLAAALATFAAAASSVGSPARG